MSAGALLGVLVGVALAAFFLLAAAVNAQILLGLGRTMRQAREEGRHVSMVPFIGGVAGAIVVGAGPWPAARAFFWIPLLLDVGCVPYLVLVLAALLMQRSSGGAPAGGQDAVPVPPPVDMSRARAIVGCILGTAVGDALGLACEGLSPARQQKLFPDLERYHLLPGRGLCSDDTEHACMLAQSLLVTAGYRDVGYHAKAFASDFARRLRFWLLGLPAGIGFATLRSILKLWLFFPPRFSGVHSAGNGPAMRSALLGVCFGGDEPRLRALVRASTRITHTDPKAEYAALAVAVAAHIAAKGAPVPASQYRGELERWLDAGGAELRLLVAKIEEFLASGRTTREFAQSIGCANGVTGYAYHTVPVALCAWLAHPGDFRGALLAAIRCGGDTDTVAAIVGAIAGSGAGKSSIPPLWLAHLWEWPRTVGWMERLGERLAHALALGYGEPEMPLSPLKILLRNAFFLMVVLLHGFRRLLPPY